MDLEKCCNLITRATNDNEKLAALLVVARNFKPTELSKIDAQNLLKAVSPSFFEKLLRSGRKNDDFLQICLILGIVKISYLVRKNSNFKCMISYIYIGTS